MSEMVLVLFPLPHGTLFCTGMSVPSPVAIYGADRVSDAQYARAEARVVERVSAIGHSEPIGYRPRNGGDYDEDLVPPPEHSPDSTGLAVHRTA